MTHWEQMQKHWIAFKYKKCIFVPFGQDEPKSKSNSMVADFSFIVPTLTEAVRGKQIQPIFIQY